MTALTVLLADAASSTLGSAKKLYSIVGSANSGYPFYETTCGTATGYGEIYNVAHSGWAASGSLGAADGNGWLWDVTTLEGQTIAAGNWTPTVRLTALNAGTLTADIIVRASKRSSGGVYTTIMTSTLTGQTLTGTATTYNLPATAGSATNFAVGDKLYIDIWCNITTNSGGSATTLIRINRISTDTTGFTGDPNEQTVTPGYSATAGATVMASTLGLMGIG